MRCLIRFVGNFDESKKLIDGLSIQLSNEWKKNAKIEFIPGQRISCVPESAGHSASIYSPKPIQIQFLRESGLGEKDIENVINEAFLNDFSLF